MIQRSSISITLMASIVVGAIAGYVGLIMVDWLETRNFAYILIFLLTLSIVVPILWRIIKRSFDLAEPCIWFALYYFTLFVMRAIYDLLFGSEIIGVKQGSSNWWVLNSALIVATIGIISFWVGNHLKVGRAISNSLPKLPSSWSRIKAFYVAILCIAVGLLSRIVLIIYLAGNFGNWVYANKYILLAQASGTQYLNLLGGLTTVGLFIFFFLARVHKKYTIWIYFSIFFIIDLIYRMFSGSRFQFILLIMSLIIGYYMSSERGYNKSLKYFLWFFVIGIIFIIMYPVLSIIRGEGLSNIESILPRAVEFWSHPIRLLQIIGARQHGLDSLAIVMEKVPEDEPFTFGSEILLLAVAWIPRQLWPEKPVISVGKIFYERFFPPIFHEGTSAAPTLPGEFYWDLGVVGVIIGMLFIGILWRFMHEYLVRPKGHLSNALIVSVIFSSFFIPAEQTLVELVSMHLLNFLIIAFITLIISGRNVTLMEAHK